LAVWFGWSMANYGVRTTLQSNTSVTSAQKYQGNPMGKIGLNIVDSIVPYLARARLNTGQSNRLGIVRDYAFSVYQVNLIFAMGLAGGPLALWLLWRFRSRCPPEWRFWRVVIPILVELGIAV